MCAIIGICTKDLTSRHLTFLGKLMTESQIRGRHATGISWVQDPGEIHTRIVEGDSKRFLLEHPLQLLFKLGEPLSLIGHCRYSTSDLEYNQPIVGDNLALVHNGVVTQREPEEWPEMFDLPAENFRTRNDSEIVLLKQAEYKASLYPRHHPLVALPDASLAVLSLDKGGTVEAYHNEKRPLWYCEDKYITFYFSTRDIGLRAGLAAEKVLPLKDNMIYTSRT